MILHQPSSGPAADPLPALRLGLALPNQFAPGSALSEGIGLALRIAAVAAASGFDAYLAGEHRLSDPYPYCDPMPLLARLAAEVGGADLIAMSLLALHHPLDVAEQVATLDAVCGGRAIVCAALGYRQVEYESFGIDWSSRLARFEEAIRLLRLLGRESTVAFDGDHFELPATQVCTRSTRPGGVPVWRAASGNRAVERAGTDGSTWLMGPTSDIRTLVQQQQRYVAAADGRAGGRVAGHDRRVPIIREVIVTPDRKRAVEIAERFLWPKYQTYRAWGQERAIGERRSFERPVMDLAEDRFIIGDVDDAVASTTEVVERLGVDLLIVHPHWPDLPEADARRTVELMGREVLPRVREVLARRSLEPA